jgi:hypothetical protein
MANKSIPHETYFSKAAFAIYERKHTSIVSDRQRFIHIKQEVVIKNSLSEAKTILMQLLVD